jgi:hypothetical protein
MLTEAGPGMVVTPVGAGGCCCAITTLIVELNAPGVPVTSTARIS